MSALFDSTEFSVKLTQVEQFIAPPTSILDASQGYWQGRRRAWETDYPSLATSDGRDLDGGFAHLKGATDPVSLMCSRNRGNGSVFDPVLAEVAYTWWSAPDSVVFDPFSGGPARGIVAAAMGRTYIGMDVREEQVDANEDVGIPGARWVCADSSSHSSPPHDLTFSCPPYGSLERYGGGVHDLSEMPFAEFRIAYKSAIRRCVSSLRDDRFAAFVVGNYKERGELRDLVSLTIESFGDAGANYFGDVVYASPGGSAALRAQASFPGNRRPMPRHQYVLVFVKGDRRRAAAYVNEAVVA